MTQNQIAFHNAQELKRHNEATEKENARHQREEERLKESANQIANESNRISREHYERMDAINSTHYQNQDAYNMAYLAESQRSNVARESLTAQQNAINAASVAETARHQAATEAIESRLAGNTIYRTAAEVSQASANAKYTLQRVRESEANIAHTRAEISVLNQQKFTEALRPILMSEQIKSEQTQRRLQDAQRYNQYAQTGLNVARTSSEAANAFGAWVKNVFTLTK